METNTSDIKISAVIPVYNSQDCLEPLVAELNKALSVFKDYELIFVNDNSKDKSWAVLSTLVKQNPQLICINFRKNFGQDNALLAGLRHATGDYAVIMDDDLQHSPADIVSLFNACIQGYDVCYANFETKNQKLWKNLGSWLNGKLSEKLLDKPKHIYLSPFKIIAKEVVAEIIKFSGPFPYIDATILTITNNITQTPVKHNARYAGTSNYNLIKSISVFIKHATSYSIYPLRLVTIVGFISAGISLLMGLFYTGQYFFTEHKVEGWISLILLLIFFGGLIMISLGLIGEYIGRIFLSINNKPQYTISQVIKKT
jgi:polyisoprenyl-phosphate glycosyltransferase